MTQSLYDGDDLLMELDGAGKVVREYMHFPGVDQPHSMRAGGQVYYYAMEQPGHVTGLFNSANQVVNRYTYDDFGRTAVDESVVQPLRYMAREHDAATGLYYVRARWNDPGMRRFVSQDPIGLEGGINPYTYANNDPVNMRDPYGLYATATCTYKWVRPVIISIGNVSESFPGHWEYSCEGGSNGQDYSPAPGSTCDREGCNTRPAQPYERERVVGVLRRLDVGIPFCRLVQEHGMAAVNRNLLFYDNAVFNSVTGKQIFGNAPSDSRFGGLPVIYLYGRPGKLNDHDIVHEAVHTVPWRGRVNPLHGYPETTRNSPALYKTPLGSIDQAASTCRGR